MAFGDNAFGGSNSGSSVGRRGRGNRGGIGGGMGGGNNRNRNRNRGNGGNGGGGGTEDAATSTADNPFDSGDVSSGDPYGSATDRPGFNATIGGSGSIFEDPDSAGGESWRSNAWGLLNQGGIMQDSAFGSQQADWLDGQMADWYDQWQGQGAMVGDDAASWLDYVYGVPGTAAPGAADMVTTTSTTPATEGGDIPDWRSWVRDETGQGVGRLNRNRLDRLREQYAALGEGGTPATTTTSSAPSQAWMQDQWGPAMQQYLTARYQSQTPRQRGTQSSAWTGPRRIIQF